MKSWEHEFVIRDFKLGPSKQLFALNNGMFGMLHECLTDDDNRLYIIFNKPARTIAKFAGSYGVSSFIYCHANAKVMWRMKNEDFKYNSVKNPYIFVGDAEVTLSDTLLHYADKAIGKAVEAVRKAFNLTGETDEHILDYIYNRTGMKAGAYREYFTEALNL